MLRSATLRGATTCLAAALFCTAAEAQLFRAYLAADGNDANPCTLQAPCRLLPAALNAVAGGGEIWMLDSANYNTATVNVNKSVSILAVPGVVGSVVALNGGPAIEITADNLAVALRNLVLGPVAGVAAGTHGVYVTGASNVTIEGSLIANLPQHGVYVAAAGTLTVSNTTLRSNGQYAIALVNGVSATIARTQMLGNAYGGISAYGVGSVTTARVDSSVVSGGEYGINAFGVLTFGGSSRVSVARSTLESAKKGIRVAPGGEVNIGSSLIVGNATAWSIEGGGSILSLGNNQTSGNGGSVGSLTPLAPQ